jgi:hypothetical protein
MLIAPARTQFALLFASLAAAVGLSGCGSNCQSNCPNVTVSIIAVDNTVNAPIIDLVWLGGPACPPYPPICRGEGYTTSCTHVDITGFASGGCDLGIVFSDRPAEIVHAEFGPPVMQGCCTGFTIVGESLFFIPRSAADSIYGADGGSDAVTVVRDGGDDTRDAGDDTRDAGTAGADARGNDAPADAPAGN